MRRLSICAALLLSACETSAKSPEKTVRADTPKQSPAPVLPAGADLPSSPTAGADEGVAELKRLAATGQQILVDHLDVDSVSAAEFVPDAASAPSAYQGEYHFGDSEWESGLTLAVEGNGVTAILGYADWENETWVGKEVRFEPATITGATVSAPTWRAVFVRYQGRPGIVILRSPTDKLGIQYGEKVN